MIRVRCVGHIRTSLGAENLELDGDDIGVGELVDKLRAMSREKDAGFNRFNTLAMVDDGEAFLPAGSSRRIRSGDSVVLIPFSHGG